MNAGSLARVFLLGISLLAMQPTTPAQNWFHPLPALSPSGRQGHAMAADTQRGRVVLFGGLNGAQNTNLGDTWEWDGVNWNQYAPAIAPSPRAGHAMAYDAQRGRTVLFGGAILGSGGYQYLNDTWEWDGVAWSHLTPATAPSARSGLMVYDAQRGRTVLFGMGASGFFDEAWEWDGTNWTQRITTGGPPLGFGGVAVVYDAQRGRTVLFSSFATATWEWDGVVWRQIIPATSPSSRNGCAMVYDPQRGRTVLFGGVVGSYQRVNDTWEWDGVNWTQRLTASSPPGRNGHVMAWDGQSGRVTLFGGITDLLFSMPADTWQYGDPPATAAEPWLAIDGPIQPGLSVQYDSGRGRAVAIGRDGGTWDYDGSRWFPRPVGVSRPRSGGVMAYDALRGHTLLWGGSGTSPEETWAWDGSAWRQLASAASPPTIPPLTASSPPDASTNAAMAFDEVRGCVVWSDGHSTWEHDGSQWTQQAPLPVPYGRILLTYDPVRRGVVLFGPRGLWLWNGTAWSQLSTINGLPAVGIAFDRARQRLVVGSVAANGFPVTTEWDGTAFTTWTTFALERSGYAMYFDPSLQKVVVHGGTTPSSSLSDLLAWNGPGWQQIAPGRRPSVRIDAALGHDPVQGGMVLFGGGVTGQSFDDTWRWDGCGWQSLTLAVHPSARSGAAMCVDPNTNRLALFGGLFTAAFQQTVFHDDLWYWQGTAWTAAASGVRPPARTGAAMAADTQRNRIVLFGGLLVSGTLGWDTWEWDGSAWAQVASSGPSGRQRAAMAYDPLLHIMLLHSGCNLPFGPIPVVWNNDTWQWIGGAWHVMPQGSLPAPLQFGAAAFDASRGRVVLVGKTNLSLPEFQAWEFTGTGWTRSLDGELPGQGLALAHDGIRARTVVYDGYGLRELSATPGVVTSYGSGCGVPAPVLCERARPRIGEPMTGLEMLVTPGTGVLFGIGGAPGSTPLGNGCTLLFEQPLATLFVMADSLGMAVHPMPTPPNPWLRGLVLYAQAGALSPTAPGGFVLSQGLRKEVGD